MERKQLGDFEILREIGRGGMGVVYLAHQKSLHRQVAVKVLAAGFGLTNRAVQRFHREAKAAAKLHHTNIVPIYSTGEYNGTHFYAMELIEGPSLDQVIRQLKRGSIDNTMFATPVATKQTALNGPDATAPYQESGGGSGSFGYGLSTSSLTSGAAYFDTVARMIAEIAEALHYAHQQGVIHRDIKPSNLLLSPSDRLCINDFGLARLVEQTGMTITGEMVGTPRYMSPEQITAGRIPVDHRTDIYSLGATLYELLTLRPPFVGDQRDQILAQVIQKEPPQPHKLNLKVPRDLETICLKALEKDPDRRYQSGALMAEDLRRYLNRFAILARRAGPFDQLGKWIRRNPALSAALAGVLVFALGATGLIYRNHLAEVRRIEELAKLEEKQLNERREAALEKAILASRLEDFDGARQAIREAEKLGCLAGQVRMLQGQLELFQSNTLQAIDHLTQAVELLPDSVAARSMLAVAYLNAGRMKEHYQTLREATEIPPITADDFLFLGHAESTGDTVRALKNIEESMRLKSSSLAYLIHIDVLRYHVLTVLDLEQTRLIMDDVRVMKRRIPDNSMILNLSLGVHTICYYVSDALQQIELKQAACNEGIKDSLALENTELNPKMALTRWFFFDAIGQPEMAIEELKKTCNNSDSSDAATHYGCYLYRNGQVEEAIRVFGTRKGEVAIEFLLLIALTEQTHDLADAQLLYRDIASRDLESWDLFNQLLALVFLGENAEAAKLCNTIKNQPEKRPPVMQEAFDRSLQYIAGQLTAEELIEVFKGNTADLCCAHFCIGLTSLSMGDRATARQHFEFCVATHQFEFVPHVASRMILSSMGRDSAWPKWVEAAPNRQQ